jgi:hypothetical protein
LKQQGCFELMKKPGKQASLPGFFMPSGDIGAKRKLNFHKSSYCRTFGANVRRGSQSAIEIEDY